MFCPSICRLSARAYRILLALMAIALVASPAHATLHYKLGDGSWINQVAFDASSQVVYAVHRSGTTSGILRWEVATQRALDAVPSPVQDSAILTVVPTADLAVSQGHYDNRGKYFVWKLSNSELVATIVEPGSFLAISIDGRKCAFQKDKEITLWSLPQVERIAVLACQGDVKSAVFSPDGRILVFAHSDPEILVWDVAAGRSIGSFLAGGKSFMFSPDGNNLFVGDHQRTGISVWEIPSLMPVALIGSAGETYGPMALSPDGQRLFIRHDHFMYEWRFNPTQLKQSKPTAAIDRLTMLSQRQNDDELKNLPMQPLTTLAPIFASIESFVISPDGRWFASLSNDHAGYRKDVMLWPAAAMGLVESTRPRRLLVAPERCHSFIAISPDSRRIAAMVGQLGILLWDLKSGGVVQSWQHKSPVGNLSFSSDGKVLAVAVDHTESQEVKGFDTQTGRESILAQYDQKLLAAAFSDKVPYQRFSGSQAVAFAPNRAVFAWITPLDEHPALFDAKSGKLINHGQRPWV